MRPLVPVASLCVLLAACASAGYKPRSEGMTRFGYEEHKLSETEYALDYYGAKSDGYEKLEQLWRKRAEVLCQSKSYEANLTQDTYEGKTFILLPPFVYYDKSGWPVLKGKLVCRT